MPDILGVNPYAPTVFDKALGTMGSVEDLTGKALQNQGQVFQNQRQQQMAKLPFGGYQLPGQAGQVLALENLRMIFGPNSPQYLQARTAFDLDQQSTKSRVGYQDALVNSMDKRYASPLGKEQIESEQTRYGYAPTGQNWNQVIGRSAKNDAIMPLGKPQPSQLSADNGVQTYGVAPAPNFNANAPAAVAPASTTKQQPDLFPIDENAKYQGVSTAATMPEPENINPVTGLPARAANNEFYNQYRLRLQRNTTDGDARKRNLLATNIEKSLDSINPEDLVQYAGLRGKGQETWQKVKSGLGGKSSPEFDKYEVSAQTAQLLAGQIRQFYGDSIQPSVRQELQTLTNPNEWYSNPDLMLKKYYAMRNLLSNEMRTYRDAMKGVDVYQNNQSLAVIPPETFPSDRAKKAWISTLTPEQKEYVKNMLRQSSGKNAGYVMEVEPMGAR